MEIGDIVQIRIPKRWKDASYYKFNCHVGEIVDLHEGCLARILESDGILWPIEWLTPFESEKDEAIQASEICELWRETE